MKKLQLNQMENLEGGLSNRQCMLAGAGILACGLLGIWGGCIGIGVGSADCW
jgi:hypothetical protein